MKLHSINISGYKSYALTMQVEFGGETVGIVGPSGCGKTSIFHAVIWVAGLRLATENDQEIFFQGTATRPPAKQVSVTLSFRVDGDPVGLRSYTKTTAPNGQFAYDDSAGAQAEGTPPESFLGLRSLIELVRDLDRFAEVHAEAPSNKIFLLDELDRDLPEDEIEWYAGLLSELSYENQMIVSSGSKTVLGVVDRLVGITMEEFGVSTVVSMRLREEG